MRAGYTGEGGQREQTWEDYEGKGGVEMGRKTNKEHTIRIGLWNIASLLNKDSLGNFARILT